MPRFHKSPGSQIHVRRIPGSFDNNRSFTDGHTAAGPHHPDDRNLIGLRDERQRSANVRNSDAHSRLGRHHNVTRSVERHGWHRRRLAARRRGSAVSRKRLWSVHDARTGDVDERLRSTTSVHQRLRCRRPLRVWLRRQRTHSRRTATRQGRHDRFFYHLRPVASRHLNVKQQLTAYLSTT